MFDPAEVVKEHGQGAIRSFTREFYHPTDQAELVVPEAAARFFQDDRRFPPSAYTVESLLWKDNVWRQPLPEERCQMMGFPAQCLRHAAGPAAVQRQRQNSLVGKGFHLPMILALFAMLPQILDAKIRPPMLDLQEVALKERLCGTIWEPGRWEASPHLLGLSEVVTGIQSLLQAFAVPDSTYVQVRQGLCCAPLHLLQAYTVWARGHGLDTAHLGPCALGSQRRADIYAGLSGQRHPGNSKRGLDHLLSPGLGKEAHIQAALQLPSPFHMRPWPEKDVDFVLHAIAVWQQVLPAYAAKCRKAVSLVTQALQPLERELTRYRCQSAQQVATTKKPAFVAFLTVILHWPDSAQLLQGYPIVGPVDPSGVFRHGPGHSTA